MKIKNSIWGLSILVVFMLNSCISFSTLQGPKTLEAGKIAITAGVVGVVEPGDSGIFPEVGARIGLTERMDFGLKVVPPFTLFMDGKLELIQAPITISADMGWSIFSSGNHETIAFYPMIIIGGDKWYVGAKRIYANIEGSVEFFGEHEYDASGWLDPSLVIGGVIGERIRFLPEVNIYLAEDGPFLMPGLGTEFHF